MERIKILALTSVTAFLSLVMPQVVPQQQSQRPLCVSQLTLANYACGRLPSLTAELPQSPPSNLLFPDDHGHDHNGHGHRHEPEHGNNNTNDTPSEVCCRWLNDLDDVCICDLLVHLPPFLARPVHQYTIIVRDACNVTYTCDGRTGA